MDEFNKKDLEYIIRLLKTAFDYGQERPVEDVELPKEDVEPVLDTVDDDVLRWEDEGGSPS